MESNMDIAKRCYPIGTKFVSIIYRDEKNSKGKMRENDSGISDNGNYVLFEGKWAKLSPPEPKVGMRVQRGPVWVFDDQGSGTCGEVVKLLGSGSDTSCNTRVKWDDGSELNYYWSNRGVIPVTPEFDTGTEKPVDVLATTDKGFEIIKDEVYIYNSGGKDWIMRAKSIGLGYLDVSYLHLENNNFCSTGSLAFRFIKRMATEDEIVWLEACEKADQYVPKEIILKVGDTIEWKQSPGVQYLVTKVTSTEFTCKCKEGVTYERNLNLLFTKNETNRVIIVIKGDSSLPKSEARYSNKDGSSKSIISKSVVKSVSRGERESFSVESLGRREERLTTSSRRRGERDLRLESSRRRRGEGLCVGERRSSRST